MSNGNRKTTARGNRHGAAAQYRWAPRTNRGNCGRQGSGHRDSYEQPEADRIDIGNGDDPAQQISAKGGHHKTGDARYISAQAPPDIPAKPQKQKNADRAYI